MKQIKLSDSHYIVVDETREITKEDWCLVTHSTQPVEPVVIDVTPGGDPIESYEYNRIKEYPLSLAKEIAGEVDVEKKAREEILYNDSKRDWWKQGYNQCLEDNKDKKYTEEDLRKAWKIGYRGESIEELPNYFQPPTEWEVEIVEGKLKRKNP